MHFFKNLTKEQIHVQIFIFFRAIIAGLVLMGVNSSFFGMLYENGINLRSMSIIPIATAPYSLKFIISPYIKNFICSKKISLVKLVKLIQVIILILFSTLGFIANNMPVTTLNIFLLTLSVSVYDILATHIKLMVFNSNEFGMVTAFSTMGFRIGMLIGGGGLAYLAYYFGWQSGFFLAISALIFLNMCLIPKTLDKCTICPETCDELRTGTKELINLIKNFVTSSIAIGIIFLILSIKIPDTSLHTTKQMFLLFRGFDKIEIANMSQIPGVFAMIVGGLIGGATTYKQPINKCLFYSLIFFAISCGLFCYLNYVHLGVWLTGLILTVSSLSCGFLNVTFRTFVDKYSQKDVNKNTLLISLGSLFKVVFGSISLLIANNNHWVLLYMLCMLSTIPGLIVSLKSNWMKKIN